LGERLPYKQEVAGSSPAPPTRRRRAVAAGERRASPVVVLTYSRITGAVLAGVRPGRIAMGDEEPAV
jgi:hypothetical protein